MKNYLSIAAAITALTSIASATPVLVGDETALQAIIDNGVVGASINVNWDQYSNDVHWTAQVDPAAYLVIEIAGYAQNNVLGIYNKNDATEKVQVFSGSVGAMGVLAPVQVFVPGSWSSFGFYLQNTVDTNFTWYSDPNLNSGNTDHFVAFQGSAGASLAPFLGGASFESNDFILGIEDLNLGDQDYNDMVVLVQNVNGVPDGGQTVVLLGAGLMGAALLRRRFLAGK